MKVVLDTSALLFWTLDPEQLSGAAAEAMDGATEILVSSLSLWEIALKHRRGKLELPMAPQVFAQELETTDRTQIVAVDWATWLESVSLDWEHRDPADRAIVALARIHGCCLVTSDEEIRRFYPRAVW
jgi:PIN domain nuclease of toxin-antitoxin system